MGFVDKAKKVLDCVDSVNEEKMQCLHFCWCILQSMKPRLQRENTCGADAHAVERERAAPTDYPGLVLEPRLELTGSTGRGCSLKRTSLGWPRAACSTSGMWRTMKRLSLCDVQGGTAARGPLRKGFPNNNKDLSRILDVRRVWLMPFLLWLTWDKMCHP